jgi:cell division initiation protein
MPYTPVELRHVRPRRTLFRGYKRSNVDELLEEVADSFEDVWRERAELADRVEEIEKQLADLRSREQLLATTLVSAEKAAADAKDQAKREAELIIAEAHQESRSITRGAQNDRERLFAEVRRIEALLRAALGMVEESGVSPGDPPPDEEQEQQPQPQPQRPAWPGREDTREFKRAGLFVPPSEDAHAG